MPQRTKLLLASNNPHKVEEIRELLPRDIQLLTLADIQWTKDIPEPFNRFDDNAKAKTQLLFQRTGLPCFADDSGLIVDALDGRPGILSARYAGEHKSSVDNMAKVLQELGDTKHRSARFIAVISFQPAKDEIHFFEGNVEGHIAMDVIGTGGFGYDPIFIPAGFDQTFGQLSPAVKKLIGHRARAMRKFSAFMSTYKLLS